MESQESNISDMVSKLQLQEQRFFVRKNDLICVEWVYRTNLHPIDSIHKHKTRLVLKGYSQMDGVDYGDTFAPTARHETIRSIVSLSSQYG